MSGSLVEIRPPVDDAHTEAEFFKLDITELVLTYVGTPADHLVIESWHPVRGWSEEREPETRLTCGRLGRMTERITHTAKSASARRSHYDDGKSSLIASMSGCELCRCPQVPRLPTVRDGPVPATVGQWLSAWMPCGEPTDVRTPTSGGGLP
jgi:hypothetical protein